MRILFELALALVALGHAHCLVHADLQHRIFLDHGARRATPAPAANNETTRPHLVFVMADDLGWSNVGYHNEHAKTPHIDRLVREGVELDRHYAYYYCAPTRAAMLTGRYPAHVNEEFDDCTPQGTAPLKMTMIAAKLKLAGYRTHQIGKWGVGQASGRSLPRMRGFDTSFGYLGSAEDHFTHKNSGCGGQCSGKIPSPDLEHWGTDLWETDRPAAFDHVGQYSSVMYNERVQRVLSQHDPSTPLFLYLAPQDAHGPDQTLPMWSSQYSNYTNGFAVYNGMASAVDSLVANLTAGLRAKGMWKDTLLVFSSDNGGPSQLGKECNASNYPLRGGKSSAWEGGHRVAAFASGGLIPPSMRGRLLDGYIHISDWYTTFCGLASVEASDSPAGLPATDGLDMWPYLSGANTSSPRTEVLLSTLNNTFHPNIMNQGGAGLIVGDWKLLRTHNNQTAITGGCSWTGPVYPNTSTPHWPRLPLAANCGSNAVLPGEKGWLFHIKNDPGEHTDVSATYPMIHAKLLARALELDLTQIDGLKGDGWRGRPDPAAACAAAASNNGTWGPHMP